MRQTQEEDTGSRTDTRTGKNDERHPPCPGGQRIERDHLDPGENVAPNRSAVSGIACNEDAPSRFRLRNANPATLSYGAAQGQKDTLNASPA